MFFPSLFLLFLHVLTVSAWYHPRIDRRPLRPFRNHTNDHIYGPPRHFGNNTDHESGMCCFTLFATPLRHEVILPALQAQNFHRPVHRNSSDGTFYIDNTSASPDTDSQFCYSNSTGARLITSDKHICTIDHITKQLRCSSHQSNQTSLYNTTSNSIISSTNTNTQDTPLKLHPNYFPHAHPLRNRWWHSKDFVWLNGEAIFLACPAFDVNTTLRGPWNIQTMPRQRPYGCFDITFTVKNFSCAANGNPGTNASVVAVNTTAPIVVTSQTHNLTFSVPVYPVPESSSCGYRFWRCDRRYRGPPVRA